MNNKKYIFMALAVSTVMLTSCSDELINDQKIIKQTGDEILFGGRARFEQSQADNNAKTRTIYTGKTYTENGKTYEGVQWQANDKVRIYCPQSNNYKVSDYVVDSENNGTTSENGDLAGLTRIDPNGALQWGNTNEAHDFYAVYPSPEQYSTDSKVFTGENPTMITGVIPNVQVHKGIADGGTIDNSDYQYVLDGNGKPTNQATKIPSSGKIHVVKPDMDFAYMVARTTIKEPNETGDGVFLNFMPIATAVEITLRNVAWSETTPEGQQILLNSVIVTNADNIPLYGEFTADLNTIDVSSEDQNIYYGTSYPTVQHNKNVAWGNSISLPMYSEGTKGKPLELNYGDAVKFTVFVLPTQDISQLNVTITGIQGSHTGKISGIQVEKHKKTYLNRVPITGDVLPFDYENWIRWLEDNVLVRELSIPGSGGAATSKLAAGGSTTVGESTVKHDNVRQQTLSISDQWKAGIRCFEFSVDANGTSESNSLGGSKIICSGIQLNYTLEEAVAEVKAKLEEKPHEFAMVIVTYETSGGWNGTRKPSLFMAQLNRFWDTVENGTNTKVGTWSTNAYNIPTGTALYDPVDMTVGDARGKLFCIARPTSIHLDYGDDVMIDVASKTLKDDGTGYTYKPTKEELEAHCTVKIERPELANHEHIMIIHGWGTLKDKWQQRGFTKYSVRRTKCNDTSLWSTFHSGHYNSYSGGIDANVENWIKTYTTYTSSMSAPNNSNVKGNKDGKLGRPFDTSKMTRSDAPNYDWDASGWSGTFPTPSQYNYDYKDLTPDFTYETSSGMKAWVQEWARVSKSGTENKDAYKIDHSPNMSYAVYWGNSYGEKLQRVKECLDYAQNKTKGDIVYINSLCGYYITDEYQSSIYPCTFTDAAVNWFWNELFSLSMSSSTAGMGGDIAGFASDINEEFYNHLLSIDTEYSAGSMGIILMDHVGTDAGASIPGVIIGNNFQFELDSETNPTMVVSEQTSESNSLSKVRNGLSAEGYNMKWE